MHRHPRRPLHARLQHESRSRVAQLIQRGGQFVDAFPLAFPRHARLRAPDRLRAVMRAPVAGGTHHLARLEKQRPIRRVKNRAVPRAHRPDRIAMVTAGQRDEDGSLCFAALDARLVDHLQRRFHRGRAIVGEKDPRAIQSRHADQLPGQPRRDIIGQPKKRAVRDPVELVPDGLVDFRAPVAVQIGPDRGVAIEVLAPILRLQHCAVPLDDDHRRVRGGIPVAHLREGMPKIGAVQVGGVHFRTSLRDIIRNRQRRIMA
jgi:hypothetical protein